MSRSTVPTIYPDPPDKTSDDIYPRSFSNTSSSFLTSSSQPSSVSPPQTQPEPPFSLQNRRLQLRNAGFRGSSLLSSSHAARKISPQLSTWRNTSVGSEPDGDKENSGVVSTHQATAGKSTSTKKRQSSILQEIGNSTQRRHSPRPSIASVFSNTSPPSSPAPSVIVPKVRQDSANVSDMDGTARSNSSSSWKNRFSSLERFKRHDMKTRDGRRETSWYIEHLESQLASAISRVESDDSTAHGTRYRALNSEYKLVKQELEELEQNFEARVQEEITAVAEREAQLRARIRAMERALETRDNKIRELEWEIEADAHRLRQLESVNSTNRSLERRVDVLTELLAQSPRVDNESMTEGLDASPVGTESQGLSRRRSVFSKNPLPLSPLRRPLSHSIGAGESGEPLPAPPDLVPASSLEEQTNDNGNDTTNDGEGDGTTGVTDPDFEDSRSIQSNNGPVSQRTSMISSSSSNLSFPLSPEAQGKLPSRRRKMRRFPSGSYTLKPLVLPSTSTTAHHLSSPTQRPVTASPSANGHSYTAYDDSPLFGDELDRQREATLNALEGKFQQYQSFEDAIANHGVSEIYDPPFSEASLDVGRSEYLSNDSLTLNEVFETPTSALAGWVEPCKRSSRQRAPSSPLLVATTLAQELEGSGYSTIRTAPRIISNAWSTGSKLDGKLVTTFTQANTVDTPTVGGLWKYALNIQRIVLYSRSLTRCILSKAWHSNWKRIGSFSWWFLGFILGPQTRNHWFKVRLQKSTINQESENSNADAFGRYTAESPDCIPCPPTLRSMTGTTRLSTIEQPRPTTKDTDMSNLLRDSSLASVFAQNPSQSMQLWMKFSVTLVLALGLAIRDGPASLMCDCLPGDTGLSQHHSNSKVLEPPPPELQADFLPESPLLQHVAPARRPATQSLNNNKYMRREPVSRYDGPENEPG